MAPKRVEWEEVVGQYTPLLVIAERNENDWRLFDKESGEVRWYPRRMTDKDLAKIEELSQQAVVT